MATGIERAGGLKSVLEHLSSKVNELFTGAVRADHPSVAKPDFNTQMAVERTVLAHERTLMAWVRTATSLISFGFTIYKFFQFESKGTVPTSQVIGPRAFASMMILMGLFALVIATIQHRESMKRQKDYGVPARTLAGWVAGLISILGLVAIISVALDL